MAISDPPVDIRPLGLTLNERAALSRAPRRPAQQWWNLAAKYNAANRIFEEERHRSAANAHDAGLRTARNNRFDAIRHAVASERVVSEVDPMTAYVAGVGHELKGWLFDGQPFGEGIMDLRNNAEGRRAAAEHRAGDLRRLQTAPSR